MIDMKITEINDVASNTVFTDRTANDVLYAGYKKRLIIVTDSRLNGLSGKR